MQTTLKQSADYKFTRTIKQAHKDSIISIAIKKDDESHNILATSADDKTVRIWDLRSNSSVKMFKNSLLNQMNISNVVFSNNNNLFLAASNNVFEFDLRNQKIINEEILQKIQCSDEDINQISIDKSYKFLVACDDSGDLTLMKINEDKRLLIQNKMQKQHTNIAYSTDFIYQNENNPICVSSAFDCQIIYWDILKNPPVPSKSTNLATIAQKCIKGQLLCPPLIYSVYGKQSSVLVSSETGHIFCFNIKDPKKPKFIIEAHLGKVMRTVFANFNENNIVSISNDKSVAIWNNLKRDEFGAPDFLIRIGIADKPNWVETSKNNKIFVADLTPDLTILDIKN